MWIPPAFLYGELDEELYLEQPHGFEQTDRDGNKLVCRLKKAIYGLKQAGRVWWLQIDSHLKGLRFSSTLSDTCVYVRESDTELIYVALYVDDLVVAASTSV